jgi:hypothetical protein
MTQENLAAGAGLQAARACAARRPDEGHAGGGDLRSHRAAVLEAKDLR